MILSNLFLAAIAVLIAGTLVFTMLSLISGLWKYRGRRVVICPEDREPAAVHIAMISAAREAIAGKHQLRLDRCSNWPERQLCGQDCLSQIQADPAGCLVRNLVNEWYRGKSCAYCQKAFGEIEWHDRQPALLGTDRSLMQWNEVAPERLPTLFQTHLPVCWNCYLAEMFRIQHPGRAVDRRWERDASGQYVTRSAVDTSAVVKPKSPAN
jgi:hypothetical protein